MLERGLPIDLHPEVEQALVDRQPLVALETTIITHGMPYPVNLETAKSVERHVHPAGVILATIGIIGGRVKIGLNVVHPLNTRSIRHLTLDTQQTDTQHLNTQHLDI